MRPLGGCGGPQVPARPSEGYYAPPRGVWGPTRNLKHRADQALEREEDQHDGKDQDRKLDHLPDESQIASIAAEQIKDCGNCDGGKRQKQEQANKDHEPEPNRNAM